MSNKNASVLIVGAGTFGLSTAWALAKDGYTNVTVIDRHPAPSVASAGHDLNKVFRTEYSNPLYSSLAVEARDSWLSEPVLAGCYHQNGYIFSVAGKSEASVRDWKAAVANSKALGVEMTDLNTPADFKAKAAFLNGPMEGWKGVYIPTAGWTHAYNALQALTDDCHRLGVKFISGAAGTMKSVIYDDDGIVLGVKAVDGTVHLAEKTILAAGAWVGSVIDVKAQVIAKAWCLVHIALTDEEVKTWKDAPVVNNRELGYMFEPDVDGKRLKVAPQLTGFTNYVAPGHSVPRSDPYPSQGIPTSALRTVREFLRQCIPSLAERPFIYERLCWDAESPDANFIITAHPEHKGLFIAGGGSAHAFKFLPILGNYVRDLIEDKLDPKLAQVWRWRPHQKPVVNESLPSVPSLDLADAPGWKRGEKL